jgi:hypothetical protein
MKMNAAQMVCPRPPGLWRGMLCGLLLLVFSSTSAIALRMPTLTVSQAIARFERFVRSHALDIDHYVLQSITYDYVTGDWFIYYLGKGASFDDALYLMLNRQGEISLLN